MSGKSSYVLYTSVYRTFQQYIEDPSIDIHYLLFSFEMSAEVLLAKLLSTYIYETYNKVVSYNEILSLTGTISDENLKLVNEAKPWLIELEKHCTIIDKPVTAKGLYAIVKDWTKEFGTYKVLEEKEEYTKEEYIPNNPQQYLLVVVDHIKLLSVSAGHTAKQEIDLACDFLIHFRNKCRLTVTIVQQLNRNFKTMERRNSVNNLLDLSDLSDSGGPAQASECVIGIYHPYREKLSKCEGYDIRQLKDRARLAQLLKGRFGVADKSVGVCFYGEISMWKELPLPSEINDYSIYLNP